MADPVFTFECSCGWVPPEDDENEDVMFAHFMEHAVSVGSDHELTMKRTDGS